MLEHLKIGKNVIKFKVTKTGYIVFLNDEDLRKHFPGDNKYSKDFFTSKLTKTTLGTISINKLKATLSQV